MTIAVGVIEPHNIAKYWEVQEIMETMYASYEPLHSMAWGIAANEILPFEEEYVASLEQISKCLQSDYKETCLAFDWVKVFIYLLKYFLIYIFSNRNIKLMNTTS